MFARRARMNRRGIGERKGGSAPTPGWIEPAFTNMIDWWRADLGVTLNVSTVSAWAGQAAAISMAQATPAKQLNFTASSANLNGQAAVIANVSAGILSVASTQTIKEILVVTTNPLTTFDNFKQIFGASGLLIRGNSGTANFRAADFPGTRYRDGVLTDAALSTANAPHMYRQVVTTPSSTGSVSCGGDGVTAGREWGGEIAEIVLLSGDADAGELADYYAYVASRYGITIS